MIYSLCDYISMLEIKLIHVSKRGSRKLFFSSNIHIQVPSSIFTHCFGIHTYKLWCSLSGNSPLGEIRAPSVNSCRATLHIYIHFSSLVSGQTSRLHTELRKKVLDVFNVAHLFFFCLSRGILLQEQKRYQEAIESYKMAIKCRPKLTSKSDWTLCSDIL